MKEWVKLSALLCVFGFLKEIRPSEHYIFQFLTSERNFTSSDVVHHAIPVSTYSQVSHLVVVFLITDLSRYKPLIIVLGLSGCVVWALLLWTKNLTGLLIAQSFQGTFASTEVAYFTYIYAKVSTEYYQQVTSHTRAALLAGKALSGFLAQIFVSFHVMQVHTINYINFSAMIAATIWALFLPRVKTSVYFHQDHNGPSPGMKQQFKNAFHIMSKHFLDAYTNKYVLRWSIWWTLSTACYIQIQTYIQALWDELGGYDASYNGAVQASFALVGFLATLIAGYMKLDWRLIGNLTLVLWCVIVSGLVIGGSQTDSLVSSYICYVIYGALFSFMITIGSTEIAKYISRDSYGLVFGFNTFLALFVQLFLTLIFVSGALGPIMTVVMQYWIYGIFHIILAALYIFIGLGIWFTSKKDLKKTYT